jgi:hypothetical protein
MILQAAIDYLVKSSPPLDGNSDKSSKNPTTTTHLFLRLQPFITKTISATGDEKGKSDDISNEHVQFYVLLFESSHTLTHYTVAQAIPHSWVESWDSNEWVEDLIVESIRLATQVVGQEYIISRMGITTKSTKVKPSNLVLHGSST